MPKRSTAGLTALFSYGDAMVIRPARVRPAARPLQAASESGFPQRIKKSPAGAEGIKTG